jgi:hypothetical protein
MVPRRRTLLVAVCALLCLPASASASAERWASPTSADSSGLCLSTSPCTIEHAVNGATAGDTIVVMQGDYEATAPLVLPAGSLIRGEVDNGYPVINGTAAFAGPTLEVAAGGTVRDLALGSDAVGEAAIRIAGGGLLERVTGVGSVNGGPGLAVTGSADQTVIRDSVFSTFSTDAAENVVRIGGSGDIAFVNVTAWSTGSASGVLCKPAGGG